MQIERDGNGSPFITWPQPRRQASDAPGFKRAWIQQKTGEKDWAGTGRYLNVVRTETLTGGPSGNATDFPVYTNLPDEQVLRAFVLGICAITGCELPKEDG